MVKALVFDVFGTLVDWRSSVAQAFRGCGLADDPAELAVAWRERLWPACGVRRRDDRSWPARADQSVGARRVRSVRARCDRVRGGRVARPQIGRASCRERGWSGGG